MQIRRATQGDIAAVDMLLARAYPRLLKHDYAPSLLVTAIPVIARAQPELVTSGTYFVAVQDERIIGAGGWTAAQPGGGAVAAGRGNVRHLVVDDRAVRRGVGRAVMTAVLDDARQAGITWMHCLSTLTAVRFYASLGFAEIGPVVLPLRAGIEFPAVAMHRDL